MGPEVGEIEVMTGGWVVVGVEIFTEVVHCPLPLYPSATKVTEGFPMTLAVTCVEPLAESLSPGNNRWSLPEVSCWKYA